MNKLDIAAIFKSDADDILKARADSIRIHGSNIRAAGNEVEVSISNYFRRMLPPRYYVSQGHLLDFNGIASSQLDIIVSDNFNLPSLMTTKDGTKYIPIDSVYAVGEIKSTYYKSNRPIHSFSETIKDIKENLHHDEIINSAFEGLNLNTNLRDSMLGSRNRILNRIFYFELFVDCGDFLFEDVSLFYKSQNIKYLPNMVVILNKGVVLRGVIEDETIKINRYPEDQSDEREDWYFMPFKGLENGSLEGNHLGVLYNSLVEHLSNSYLEPPTLKGYISPLMIGRKSLLEKASDY